MHVRSQSFPAALHTMMGVQVSIWGVGQVPAALQKAALVAMPVLQVAAAHRVPGA